MKFFNILKELRSEKGLTQTELANALGITRSRLSMYETGDREPDFETLELFADFFNVDVDYLLGRSDKTTRLISSSAQVPAAAPYNYNPGSSDFSDFSDAVGCNRMTPSDVMDIVNQYGTDTPEQRAALSAALDAVDIPVKKRELIQRILRMEPEQVAAFLAMAQQMPQ